MTPIIPAIIAETQEELTTALKKLEGVKVTIMLDVMDGEMVPSRSLDFKMILPEGEYQAHLMVKDVWGYVDQLDDIIKTLIVHAESLTELEKDVNRLASYDGELFLAINPGTPVSTITPVLDKLQGVLIMTVNPGGYGAKFLPECLEKVTELKKLSPSLVVEVDGGMVPETVKLAKTAGADLYASGSYIMKSPDPASAIRRLETAVS
ncbi:MAG: hypothetical protein NWE89_15890 [Candidatus Bathyarchaeota archaeon]|nr:hypothetical protein [Candidatus Bathyarchaeota archaeon]